MAVPSPFAAAPASLSMVSGPEISQAMPELGTRAELRQMSVVLIDMTKQPKNGGVGFSYYGGTNADTTRYSASLVKIAAMFAAFRLRKNFRAAADELPAKTPEELRALVTEAWKPIVEKSVGGAKDFPDLKRIFDIAGSNGNWTVHFTDKYMKDMEDMIGPSDNEAASRCILPLGYQYIQGALAAEGLYSGGGLWLAGDYSKGRDGIPEPKSKSHQAADAASVAKFMALLVKQDLVENTASAVMRRIMNNCFMTRILTTNERTYAPYSFGKLGIGTDGSRHDCAVIERTLDNGKVVRYVAVILGAQNPTALWTVGKFLDDIIAWVHK